MRIGVIGLGRMGGNISRRLMRAGHSCVVFDANPKAAEAVAADGATAATSLDDLVGKLTGSPKAIWVMLPAGPVTEQTVMTLGGLLGAGDIVIDGGNSYFRDDIRRAAALAPKGVRYVDVGTSGGVWGLERGYCLMVGAEPEAFAHLDPIFEALAPGVGDIARTPSRTGRPGPAEKGYIHAGTVGAGHFVKMVHNGIEYGMMQAIAEGFDILRSRQHTQTLPDAERFPLNMADIAEVWRRGSVIASWLLDLAAISLLDSPDLEIGRAHV